MKVSYLPGVGRCVLFFFPLLLVVVVVVLRRFLQSKRKQTFRLGVGVGGEGRNNKPALFCFCQLSPLREPAKLSSPSIFIHWHSALRQLEVLVQSRQWRVGFIFPSFAPPAAEIFSCWLTASPFQPCWGFSKWSDPKGLEVTQPEVLKGHLKICHLEKLLSASCVHGSVSSSVVPLLNWPVHCE